MKTPRIANAVGYIDDDLITAAAENKKPRLNLWAKWGAAAACLAVVAAAAAVLLPLLQATDSNGRYKNFHTESTALVWPVEYLAEHEKFSTLDINGVSYHAKGSTPLSEELIGESLGSFTAFGYDEYSDETFSAEFEVYTLKDIHQSQFVAMKTSDGFFVFQCDEYAPPSTLGELFELVDLPKVISLSRFSEEDSNPDSNHFALTDDSYIWEVLASCKDAPFIEDQTWMAHDRDYISFTVTSDAIGVYRVAMYITGDGYLWTNAFSYQYLFFIGEDAAKEIIDYAKGNSEKVEYEPYLNTVAGVVTEVTDEYILLDDTTLCENPDDGVTYKILLNDLRIARYVYVGIIEEGAAVQISYKGDIDTENANTVDSAVSADEIHFSGGDAVILE